MSAGARDEVDRSRVRALLARVMITAGEGEAPSPDATTLAERARRHDATMLLLREKHLESDELARRAAALVALAEQPVVVAHDARAASRAGAAGVHLGRASGSVAAARAALSPEALVGASVHDLSEAERRLAEGADYLMFGPVRATPKGGVEVPGAGYEALRSVVVASRVPVLAVGGMGPEAARAASDVGAAGWAAIRAFLPGGSA